MWHSLLELVRGKGALVGTPFRRLFIDHGHLCCDVGSTGVGERLYYLPNPAPGGARYDPRSMLNRVRERGAVELDRWRPM